MCCDKLLAYIAHFTGEMCILWTEANRRYIVLTNMPIRPGTFIICSEEAATAKDCALKVDLGDQRSNENCERPEQFRRKLPARIAWGGLMVR